MRILLLIMLMIVFPCIAAAQDAEFAIRWHPSDSDTSLNSANQVVALFQTGGTIKQDSYTVIYYDLKPLLLSEVPNLKIIARKRTKNDGKSEEITIKYRTPEDITNLFDSKPNICPLSKYFGKTEITSKFEADISFGEKDAYKRLYSFSCSVEKKSAKVDFPPGLQPKEKGTSRKMRRISIENNRFGKLKIEEWSEIDGKILIEVSVNGKNNQSDISNFDETIVSLLLKNKIKPILDNKSD